MQNGWITVLTTLTLAGACAPLALGDADAGDAAPAATGDAEYSDLDADRGGLPDVAGLSWDVPMSLDDSCAPGETRPCPCLDGSAVDQACRNDGLGWNVCACATEASPEQITGGDGGPSGSDAGGEGEGEGDETPDAGRGDADETRVTIDTCAELVSSLSRCADDACRDEAFSRADPGAYEEYQTMLACWGRFCAAVVGDVEAFDACVDEHCQQQTDQCLRPGA